MAASGKTTEKKVRLPVYTKAEIAKIAADLEGKRITEWLDPKGAAGDVSYKCRTNHGWLQCEAARLVAKGTRVMVVRYHDKEAIFRIALGETVYDIIRKLDLVKEEV